MATPRLLLLGWGGADWRVLQPLLDAGRLPHLLSLVEGGVGGRLLSVVPSNAASRWASVATGRLADDHGVLGWVRPGPDGQGVTPASPADWRAPPLWDMVCRAGGRAAVVGWPATHPAITPATDSAATVVSDAFAEARGASFDDWPVAEGAVWPPALAEVLAEARLHPSEVTIDQVLPFCPQAARIDQETDPRLPLIVATLARAASVHGAGTWLAEHGDWELLTVHFDLIERLSAAFMACRPPRLPQISQTDFEIYGDVVDGAYQFMDLLLGRYLALVGPRTRVLVVSPHGFYSDHLRPAPGPAELGDPVEPRYRPFGILVAAGPGIKHDEPVLGATVLDIAPTVLHLLGRQPPPGLEGRVLAELIDAPPSPAVPPAPAAGAAASAEPPAAWAVASVALDAEWAHVRLRELHALGYLPPLSRHPEEAAEQAELAGLINLAEVKSARGHQEQALAVLAQALALDPGRQSTRLAIAQSHFSLGDLARCREVLNDLVATGLRGPFLDYLLGQLCLQEGDVAAAREHLLRAAAAGFGGRVLPERIGRVHLLAQDWDAAEQAFRQALQADPEFAMAHHGLGQAMAARGQHAEAVFHLQRSTGLLFAQPEVHFDLGCSLAALGRASEAAAAFGRALAMRPAYPQAQAAMVQVQAVMARQALDDSRTRSGLARKPAD